MVRLGSGLWLGIELGLNPWINEHSDYQTLVLSTYNHHYCFCINLNNIHHVHSTCRKNVLTIVAALIGAG